jgi:hypothetical protein
MSEDFGSNWVGRIPANPEVNRGKKYQEVVAANQDLSVRGRATQRVVVPAPPMDEQVPVLPPAQRRNFGPGPANASSHTTRRQG